MRKQLFSVSELRALGRFLDGDAELDARRVVNLLGLDSTAFVGEDLTDADFSCGQDFSGFSFQGALMTGAVLRDSKFDSADFRNATLVGADFRNSSLCGINLEGSNLDNALFDGADLSQSTGTPRAQRLASAIRVRGSPTWMTSEKEPSGFEPQCTVAGPIIFAGIGQHTGLAVRVAIRPANVNAGIVFIRTDVLDRENKIIVHPNNVCQTQLGTVLNNAEDVRISSIERLMAALSMLRIDNVVVEIDGPEVPVMDGSALPFVQLLDRAGRHEQPTARQRIEILQRVEVSEGDKSCALTPSDVFEVSLEIDFASKAIGRQRFDASVDEDVFRSELANCRLFGFARDFEALKAIGLARGFSLENSVLVDGDMVLNPGGLRRPTEFVGMKVIDAIGDLAILGHPIVGRFEGVRSGHGLNNAVIRALLAHPGAWRYVDDRNEVRAQA
jgi:UDP-3-O-[3-hydroxymyristoyl] N-acetylglucosamine deacetylase